MVADAHVLDARADAPENRAVADGTAVVGLVASVPRKEPCGVAAAESAHDLVGDAADELPFVVRIDCNRAKSDRNCFFAGGQVDGDGLASCAEIANFCHYTVRDVTFLNGLKSGLHVVGGCELFANNLYFICNLPGLAGNVGFLTYIGDSHFTDMVVVDYTVGVRDLKWSNRYTRCHVWGGPVKKAGTDEPEYLPNSIAFDLAGADCLLDDCYADTAMIGFRVRRDARIFNCGYFNNWVFKMDGPEVFVHEGGSLIVTGGRFSKNSPHATLYSRGEKAKRLIWRDNQPLNFTTEEMKGLNEELQKQGAADKAALNDAKLAG